MSKEQDKLKEALLKIENCETDVECPSGQGISDDPCAECRMNQLMPIIADHCYLKDKDQTLPGNMVILTPTFNPGFRKVKEIEV